MGEIDSDREFGRFLPCPDELASNILHVVSKVSFI